VEVCQLCILPTPSFCDIQSESEPYSLEMSSLDLDELELDDKGNSVGSDEGVELLEDEEDPEYGMDPRSLNLDSSFDEEGGEEERIGDHSISSIFKSLRSGGKLAKVTFACVAAFVVVLVLTGIAAHVGAKTKDDGGVGVEGEDWFAEQVRAKMNLSVDPCEDFYRYSCGNWLSNTTIPSTLASWGSFNIIDEDNEEKLKEILEEDWPLIGTLYHSCMDTKNIDERGVVPLFETILTPISQIESKQDLVDLVSLLHRFGISVFFNIYVDADFNNPTLNLLQLDQGGITLPSSDYYLNPSNDTNFSKLQQDLRNHYETLLKLAHPEGEEEEEDFSTQAQTCFDIEDALGRMSRPPVDRRDPHSLYHPKTLKEVSKLIPTFDWNRYWQNINLQNATQNSMVNVVEVEFFTGLQVSLLFLSLSPCPTLLFLFLFLLPFFFNFSFSFSFSLPTFFFSFRCRISSPLKVWKI
jgi:hypothetical protein